MDVAGGRQLLENLDDFAVDLRVLQCVDLERQVQTVLLGDLILDHVDSHLICLCWVLPNLRSPLLWIHVFNRGKLIID